MTQELKPCPFCGWKAIHSIKQDGIAWCQCPECSCEGPTEETEADSIDAWNRRANPTSVPEGWQLVPIEPTHELRKAMHHAYWQTPHLPYHDGSPELWNATYAALLAAAPKPSCA